MRLASPGSLPRCAALPAAIALLALLAAVPQGRCDVLLNEFLPAPARDWNGDGTVSSRDDEWVEIVNTGTGPVDLSGYLLSDTDSTIRYALTGTLAAGERRLVFGLEAVDWQRSEGRTISGLSLNNAGDTLRLFVVAGSDTVQVDAYGYKSHEGASDRSSGRLPDGGVWTLFDGLNPYTGSLEPGPSGCNPSPGEANRCSATETRDSTWGRLKGAYR